MCGSIPKGTAKPYESDADFTILVKSMNDIDRQLLAHLKVDALNAFPMVTKIDTAICTLEDVLTKPNDWGFWVKIVCVNIYGPDLGDTIAPIVVSPQFIIDLNAETKQAIERVSDALLKTTDDKMKRQYIRGYSKRLIRALYSLILIDVGVWKDDIAEMTNLLIQFSCINVSLVEYLYSSYLNSDQNIQVFKEKQMKSMLILNSN